jgi:hypothetical protein
MTEKCIKNWILGFLSASKTAIGGGVELSIKFLFLFWALVRRRLKKLRFIVSATSKSKNYVEGECIYAFRMIKAAKNSWG